MTPSNFNLDDANKFYSDALSRTGWDGPRSSIGTIRMLAKEGGYISSVDTNHQNINNFDITLAKPSFWADGMHEREFAGPIVQDGARLFPMKAISLLVALGGLGKTTLIVSIAAHIAAGKNWNGNSVDKKRVIIFCVEELKAELDRKFCACVENWSPNEIVEAQNNLLFFSCLNFDSRLTKINQGQFSGTEITDQMIEVARRFKAELVFIDHIQGFISGDINSSETSTCLAREANKIVSETGAAVVLAAHISKANIKAENVEQGFAVGSLAIENAARQLVGIIPMSDKDAKSYGLENIKSEYMHLAIPKNSYGKRNVEMWLKRTHSAKFHTVSIHPVSLKVPISPLKKSAKQRLSDQIEIYIQNNPATTPNQLDLESGISGIFRASKQKIREACTLLLDDGRVISRDITSDERKQYGCPPQVKKIYVVQSSPPT